MHKHILCFIFFLLCNTFLKTMDLPIELQNQSFTPKQQKLINTLYNNERFQIQPRYINFSYYGKINRHFPKNLYQSLNKTLIQRFNDIYNNAQEIEQDLKKNKQEVRRIQRDCGAIHYSPPKPIISQQHICVRKKPYFLQTPIIPLDDGLSEEQKKVFNKMQHYKEFPHRAKAKTLDNLFDRIDQLFSENSWPQHNRYLFDTLAKIVIDKALIVLSDTQSSTEQCLDAIDCLITLFESVPSIAHDPLFIYMITKAQENEFLALQRYYPFFSPSLLTKSKNANILHNVGIFHNKK